MLFARRCETRTSTSLNGRIIIIFNTVRYYADAVFEWIQADGQQATIPCRNVAAASATSSSASIHLRCPGTKPSSLTLCSQIPRVKQLYRLRRRAAIYYSFINTSAGPRVKYSTTTICRQGLHNLRLARSPCSVAYRCCKHATNKWNTSTKDIVT